MSGTSWLAPHLTKRVTSLSNSGRRSVRRLSPGQIAVLEQTLEALHWHDWHRDSTAAALHVHVNTVKYRTRTIEAFTGWRIDDAEVRYRIRQAMDTAAQRQAEREVEGALMLATAKARIEQWVRTGTMEPAQPSLEELANRARARRG